MIGVGENSEFGEVFKMMQNQEVKHVISLLVFLSHAQTGLFVCIFILLFVT